MIELSELVARVKAASEPDRELDADICAALEGGEIVWKQANYTMESYPALRRQSKHHIGGWVNEHCPLVTASVDDSLALVERMLPGCGVVVDREPVAKAGGLCGARVYGWIAPEGPEGEGETWAGFDATGASYSLAILAALFAALQSQAPAP